MPKVLVLGDELAGEASVVTVAYLEHLNHVPATGRKTP